MTLLSVYSLYFMCLALSVVCTFNLQTGRIVCVALYLGNEIKTQVDLIRLGLASVCMVIMSQ